MDPTPERLSRTIWVGVGLLIVILCLSFVLSQARGRRPAPRLDVINPVADFTLTNQDGRSFTLADLRGKVWIADVVFTSCAGPCPRMTQQMKSLQDATRGSAVQLVTLTTDPETDTPEVLKKYAAHFAADPARWHFLTGTKLALAGLAVDSLKLSVVEKKPEERTDQFDLFIHSTLFVLVDKQARMRAFFETGGEGVSWDQVRTQILAAATQLEREP